MVYWKNIGPMSWSDDGEWIYFIYDNRSTDAVFRASTSVPNKAERIYESAQKITMLQAVGDQVYLSAGKALKVAVSDGTATPVVVPGYTPKAAFRSASDDTVFIANDKTTGKDALWVQSRDGTTLQIDPGPIDTSLDSRIAASGDRKRLIFPSPSKGWAILEMSPPYQVQAFGKGPAIGWSTNSSVYVGRSEKCDGICNFDLSNGFVSTSLKIGANFIQTSFNGKLISYPVGVNGPPDHRVNGLAISRPDGSDYRLILDGNILPQGPLSTDILRGWL